MPIRRGNREVAEIRVKNRPGESKIEQNRMSVPTIGKIDDADLRQSTHQGGEQMAGAVFG
jgi:hypothetical protein